MFVGWWTRWKPPIPFASHAWASNMHKRCWQTPTSANNAIQVESLSSVCKCWWSQRLIPTILTPRQNPAINPASTCMGKCKKILPGIAQGAILKWWWGTPYSWNDLSQTDMVVAALPWLVMPEGASPIVIYLTQFSENLGYARNKTFRQTFLQINSWKQCMKTLTIFWAAQESLHFL